MVIVNGFQALIIITKHSILDVAAALDPPLHLISKSITFFRQSTGMNSLERSVIAVNYSSHFSAFPN